MRHLQRVLHADRGRLLIRTPGPVPLELAYVLLVETNPFSELVVIFTDYALRIFLGIFSMLPNMIMQTIVFYEKSSTGGSALQYILFEKGWCNIIEIFGITM